MALASLGFSGGPQVTFRLNPSSIDWGFDIHTSVVNTVGGRVVQITGATLRDITVVGYLGENRNAGASASGDHPGASWRLHEAFIARCRQIMEHQSRDATTPGMMHPPATFNYPARDWRWKVYLMDVADIDGQASIEHRTGKFSHGYQLKLFIVQAGSASLVKAGTSKDEVDIAQEKAITSYIARISEGIGWRQSEYNGPSGTEGPLEADKGQEE
ncbi:hypothetical protein ACPCSE_29710 [Streptomyces cellulosae]